MRLAGCIDGGVGREYAHEVGEPLLAFFVFFIDITIDSGQDAPRTEGSEAFVEEFSGAAELGVAAVSKGEDRKAEVFETRCGVGIEFVPERLGVIRQIAIAIGAGDDADARLFSEFRRGGGIEADGFGLEAATGGIFSEFFGKGFGAASLGAPEEEKGAERGFGWGGILGSSAEESGKVAVDPLTLGCIKGRVFRNLWADDVHVGRMAA